MKVEAKIIAATNKEIEKKKRSKQFNPFKNSIERQLKFVYNKNEELPKLVISATNLNTTKTENQ
jgi:hypothetical protein